jgi:hypothetical protein
MLRLNIEIFLSLVCKNGESFFVFPPNLHGIPHLDNTYAVDKLGLPVPNCLSINLEKSRAGDRQLHFLPATHPFEILLWHSPDAAESNIPIGRCRAGWVTA